MGQMDTKEKIIQKVNKLVEVNNQKILTLWACFCAERVLSYFEEEHQEDKRPREAIEIGRLWVQGGIEMWDARKYAFKAHEAARAATAKQAIFAARACGQAVATVHVAGHAIHAAEYAIKCMNVNGKEEGNKEREWQYECLYSLINNKEGFYVN